MGRKRKAGAVPPPLLPSFSGHARPITPSARNTAPAKKASQHTDPSPSTYKKSRKRARQERAAPPPATPAPTSPLLAPGVAPLVSSAPPPFSCAVQPPLSPSLLPNSADHDAAEHRTSQTQTSTTAAAEATPQATPRATLQATPQQATPRATPQAKPKSTPQPVVPGMTPSAILAQLLHATGWQLGSCWGSDCHCTAFRPPPTDPAAAAAAAVAAAETGPLCSSCGHRSVAHELIDAEEQQHQHQQHQQALSARYRYSSGGNHAAGATATETGVSLRRFFSAIRNARAVGHCDLFEDSEGVRGWGAGWFLSRHARRYLQEARESAAELGGALHDLPAVARSLAAAETLLSGNAAGHWAMPASLPSASTYQALGTGIASELDLAYWHAHYTAASLFDAGGVTADTAASVVPPPEVYFVGLAFHVPSLGELRTFPGMTNPALRDMLSRVFDLPVHAEEVRVAGSPGDSGGQMDGEISFPVLTNPLLAVAQSAWLETAISACAKSWVPHFPPLFGDSEGTMRGSCPALPAPVRARCDATRDWSARLFAFAVPNRQAVRACRRAVEVCGGHGAGIIEVGAGLGYWKWVLEGAGVGKSGEGGIANRDRLAGSAPGEPAAAAVHRSSRGVRSADRLEHTVVSPLRVLAVDKDPPKLPRSIGWEGSATVAGGRNCANVVGEAGRERGSRGRGCGGRKGGGGGGTRGRGKGGARRRGDQAGPPVRSNEYHGGAPAWAAVEVGGPERLRSVSASAYPVLLLCYPPPSLGGAGVGAAPPPCMGADALQIFSGKVLLYVGEVGGDTGSPRLEAALRAGWNLVEDVDLPCSPTTANHLMVFTRKGGVFPHPFQSGGAKLADCQYGSSRSGTEMEVAAGRPDAGSEGAAAEKGGGRGPTLPMYRCSRCQAGSGKGVKLRRCRLTRAVTYCSGRCLSLDDEKWRANLEARHGYISNRAGPAAERDGSMFRDKKLFKRLAV